MNQALPMIGPHNCLPTIKSPTISFATSINSTLSSSKKRLVIVVTIVGTLVLGAIVYASWYYEFLTLDNFKRCWECLWSACIFIGGACKSWWTRGWDVCSRMCKRCWNGGCRACRWAWKVLTRCWRCWILLWAFLLPCPALFLFHPELERRFNPSELLAYKTALVLNLGTLILPPCAIALDHTWQTIVLSVLSSSYYFLRMVKDAKKFKDFVRTNKDIEKIISS
ncbi:uncharacterized protein EV420DRAFT_702096 [Desarmillaria tabescens]|uniref:Transmembrane protein n=1 Tax=Armillaria tabescens TaxID=1929756 RepID=A0AA39MZ51_ARMTA|nr:uncharacterized protein EV420DRAFT_702096 [Desarmillaria tabescens]KAK0451997.1 hypothetical protein EV420DRAFT_702096 [Desarmillaria tabescens]